MDTDLDMVAHVGTLNTIADHLFEALRAIRLLRTDMSVDDVDLHSHFAQEHWRNLPNTVRLALLELIYITYTQSDEQPEELIQWRRDIYTELDVDTDKAGRLRIVK